MKNSRRLSGKNRYFFISLSFLIIALAWQYLGSLYYNQPDYFNTRIETALNKQIKQAFKEHEIYNSLLTHAGTDADIYQLLEKSILNPLFSYQNGRLLHWTDYRYVPRYRDVATSDSVSFFSGTKGKYIICRSENVNSGQKREVVSLILLASEPKILNQFLKPEFNASVFDVQEFELYDQPQEGAYDIFLNRNQYLFSIRYGTAYKVNSFWLAHIITLLVYMSLIFFVIFLVRRTWSYIDRFKYLKGFLFLCLSLALVRFFMLAADFPYSVLPVDLFDLRNYASSALNPSLGDLLLNMAALTAIAGYLFRHYFKTIIFKELLKSNAWVKTLVSVLLVLVTYLILTFQYNLVYSLCFHSQWSLDITDQLSLNRFKFLSYLIIFLGGIIYFLISHVAFKTFFRINRLNSLSILSNFLVATGLFALWAFLAGWNFAFVMGVNIIYYLILYLFQLPDSIGRIQYVTFVYLFIAGLPSAVISAHAIYKDSIRQKAIEEERLAMQLLAENDPYTEFLLTDAIEKIQNDVFIQNRIFSPYTSKEIIRQKIRRVFLNYYLDRYDIQIYVFNSLGEPFDEGLLNYRQIRERYSEYISDHPDIYFISRYDEGLLNRYLSFIEVRRYNQLAGYVVLDLRLKRIIPNSVYPLLLTDNRFIQIVEQKDLSYGIFGVKKLIYSYGDFNYEKEFDLNLEGLYSRRGLLWKDHVHRAFYGDDDKTIVVSSQPWPGIRAITNFSFLFLLFALSIFVILLITSIYVKIKNLKQNYATRIQMFLNIAYFVPLLVVCITVVSVLLQSYRQETEKEYLDRARSLSTRLSGILKGHNDGLLDNEQLRVQISEIAGYSELDINLFNTNGRLLVSSQPLIYENELLSEQINPGALYHIARLKNNYVILDENVGELTFKNTYFGVRSSDTGELVAILSLPFFDFKIEYEENVIDVLMNVMNLFTFVFLLFLFASYFASRWLTFPLRLITQKIRRTTLSYNEPLEWKSDDEIGLMVGEYNKMLENLEESRKALARSEKETAWREMAQQVAHEIKNPLTPMQLTLQHMRRTINAEKDSESKGRLRQIDSLLHQINTLSDIATSFSEFAKMPVPGSEKFDFGLLLKETIALYDNKESGSIETSIEKGNFQVMGDRKWIGRAISNIIINGFQSGAEGEPVKLTIRLAHLKNRKLLLSVKDNGLGIPDEIREKIFIPNFSTKASGTGIGLAIARRGIEHAGGKIWFETETARGTTFFIELPELKEE